MNIDLIVIKTGSPEKLADFYKLLGIDFEYHQHGNGPLHYAARINGIVFEIYPLPKNRETADDTLRLGIAVRGIDALIPKLKAAGVKIVKAPVVTEWGYQAVIEDLDGRKIEIREEKVITARYRIEDIFKITGRGLVMSGEVMEGDIYIGDEITFNANKLTRKRLIKGIDVGMRKMPPPFKTGLMIQCIHEDEINELREWKPEGEIAIITRPIPEQTK